jgi:hypothetical protein
MVGEGLWDKKNLIDVHVVVPVPFVARKEEEETKKCDSAGKAEQPSPGPGPGSDGKVLKNGYPHDVLVHVLGWTRDHEKIHKYHQDTQC